MQYYLFVALTIVGWGVGSLFYGVANNSIHPLMVSAIAAGIFIVLSALSFIFLKFDHTLNTHGVLMTVIGSLCMCAGSMGFFFALREGAAGITTAMTALYPALTLVLSAIFLHEGLSIKQVVGMGFALVAFFLLG